jgi:hypothetical protein
MGLFNRQLGQSNLEQAIVIASRYDFGIDGGWEIENSFKAAVLNFSKPVGGLIGIMSGDSITLNPDGLTADFNFQVIFIDSGNLGDNNDFLRRFSCPSVVSRNARQA